MGLIDALEDTFGDSTVESYEKSIHFIESLGLIGILSEMESKKAIEEMDEIYSADYWDGGEPDAK